MSLYISSLCAGIILLIFGLILIWILFAQVHSKKDYVSCEIRYENNYLFVSIIRKLCKAGRKYKVQIFVNKNKVIDEHVKANITGNFLCTYRFSLNNQGDVNTGLSINRNVDILDVVMDGQLKANILNR